MPAYVIQVPVEARGYQWFRVRAKTESEALKKFEEVGGTFLFEEIEVQNLDTANAEAKLETP